MAQDYFDPARAVSIGGGNEDFDPGRAELIQPAGGTASDLAKSLKVGTQRLPGMVTGLADLPFALAAGARPFTKAADALGEVTGFQPGKWADETKFSAGYEQGKKAVDEAWKDGSAGDIALAYLKNPGYTANQVVESAPGMVAGGLAGRALMGVGRVAAPAARAGGVGPAVPGLAERALGQWAAPVAAGVGEGAVTAGQQMAQYQGEDQQTNALASLGAGVGTGVLGAGMGRVANRLGLETAETAISKAGTGAAKAADDVPLSAKRRILGGMVSEALLQELPQSAQEQMWQNWADGKPLMEGVARAATEGAIAGGVMGAGANVSDGGAGKRRALAEQQAKQLSEAEAEALRADPSRAWTTEAGAADPNQPAGERAAPPEAPELQTIPGAAGPRDGLDFTRDVDTAGLTMQDPAEVERARAATMDYEPTDATPQWDTTRGAAQDRQPGLDMPAPEFDTGALGLESSGTSLTPSQQMGIDPAAGPLSKAAATSVDSGLSQEAQFLGATGRDLQVRRTGPGVADESNVIDVQGRVIEDRAIGTPRRLTAQDGARESGAIAFQDGVPRSEIAAIPNIVARAEQLRGYDEAAQKAAQPLALPAPSNLREGLERIRAQREQAARTAQVPPTTGATSVPQANQAQQAVSQQPQAGGQAIAGPAAPAAAQPAALGGSGVQAAGLTNGAPTQNTGAQSSTAAGAQGQAPQTAVARPDGWRKSMLRAAPIARAMGIDPKGKRLAQVVAEIDAADAQRTGVRQDGAKSTPVTRAGDIARGLRDQIDGIAAQDKRQGMYRQEALRLRAAADGMGATSEPGAAYAAAADMLDAWAGQVGADSVADIAALHEANGPYPPSAATRIGEGQWLPAVKTGPDSGQPIAGAPTFSDAGSAAAWAGYEQAKGRAGADVAALQRLQDSIEGRQQPIGETDAAPRNLRLADERAPGAAAPAQDGAGPAAGGAAPAVGDGRRAGGSAAQPAPAVRAAVPDAGGTGKQGSGVAPQGRPPKWRGNMVAAAKVAKGLGIDVRKYKRTADLVRAIDEADGKAEKPKPKPEPQTAKGDEPMSVGTAPGSSEPVTVRDGVVYLGKYEALNYDTGEPVTVPKGSTREDVHKALRDAGALTKNDKAFGLRGREAALMFSRAGASSPQSLSDVRARLDVLGVEHTLSESRGVLTVGKVVVPDGQRERGAGTAAMQAITDYADAAGLHVTLTPSADFGGNKSRLTRFYKRFGFKENKGRSKVYEVSESMVREHPTGRVLYSRAPATKAAYEARIDALFAGEKAAGPNSGVRVLDRSDVLGLLGFGEGPVNLAEGRVIKGQTNHQRMTAEQWKKVPEWLDNPAAVFDSDTVPGALVLIAPETINGATVRMTVEPRKDGGADVHILSNAYDAPGFTPFARWFREGLGLLVDQKKFPAVLGDSGLQLSSSTWQNKPGMRNILTEKHLDGYRRKNSPAAMSRAAQPLRTPAATIRAAITKAYGKLLGQLESKGLVTLTQTQEQAIEAAARARADKTGQPLAEVRASLMGSVSNSVATDDLDIRRSANGAIQGFFDPQTGQSFLIADNLTAEAAPGVLMHEVGIHMAADGSMKALFNRAAMMLKLQRGNPFMKAVQARMDAAGETSGEEAAAYIAEAYENDRANAPASVQRWLSDLLAAVKAWMFKKGIMGADRLTVADIAAVARANARSMARDGGAKGGQGFGPAFSVGEEVGAKALAEFAKADELFALPKSGKDTVSGIAADIDPEITVRVTRLPGETMYTLSHPAFGVARITERSGNPYGPSLYGYNQVDGEITDQITERPGENPEDVEPGTGDVWVDVSLLKPGQGGEKIYAIAANYAHNTGQIFIGDPAGLSKVALRRRLEQMLSSALKFGTTAHLAPHPDQVRGGDGVPALQWVYGDHVGNVERMIAASVKALDNAMPSSTLIAYDPDRGFYRTDTGRSLARGQLAFVLKRSASEYRLAHGAGAAGQAGWRTIARAALFRHLQSTIAAAHGGLQERGQLLAGAGANVSRLHSDGTTGRVGSEEERKTRIFYSRSVAASERIGGALKSITVTDLKNQAAFKAADLRPLGLQFLGRRQLVDVYGDMLPELRRYSDLMARMDADKNEAGAGADKLAQDWAKLPDERQLAELMHDSTLAQIDPTKDFVEGDNKTDWTRLRARYQALSPAAKEVYIRARDTYRQHMHDVRSAIKERIERAEMSSERRAALLKRMDDEFFGHIKGVYFPLARFGQYVVVVKGADGKVENVSRAETMAEADTTRRQLLAAFPPGKGFTVGKVLKAKDFVAERDTVGRGFMEQLYGVLDKQGMDAKQRAELEDALGQLYLSSLPDLSWAKHGIHRKGTAGFSQDARRAFAQNVFHGASYLAKLRYGDQLQNELGEMQRRVDAGSTDSSFDSVKAQQVVDEMVKRHDAAMNPKTNALSTALTSLGFMFHLGLSPASAMVNLTQTALVAYPVMGARWGFAKAGAALLQASQEAARGKNDITASLTADEKAAFDEAVRSGVIDVTMAHDLAGIAQGEDRNVSHKLQPVMKAASFLFHHAEKFNRQVTFVAAYRLAREAGADAKAAYAQAAQATYDGHFDYSANNRPRVMQGNVARVLLLFKQYGQNMVYTLARSAQQSLKGATPEARAQARKALGGLLTTHAMAAGVLGLPMVTTLLAAASMIGGDDDEPWDAKVALQNLLADTFGQKPAEVLAHGLSRLTPWDISGRVGLDKLIFPDVQEGLEGQRLAESAMTAALGPVAGIGINALKGLQEMSEGRYLRGLETMAPSVARGPLKAIRYGSEGVKDKTGIVVQDEVDAAALWGQAAGFSPSSVRNAYEGKSAIVGHDRALQARRSALVEQFAMAAMAKDEEGKAEAREAIAKFNEKNPNRRIQPMQLAQSVAMRQKRIREAQDGVYLPGKRRDAVEVGRFAFAGTD